MQKPLLSAGRIWTNHFEWKYDKGNRWQCYYLDRRKTAQYRAASVCIFAAFAALPLALAVCRWRCLLSGTRQTPGHGGQVNAMNTFSGCPDGSELEGSELADLEVLLPPLHVCMVTSKCVTQQRMLLNEWCVSACGAAGRARGTRTHSCVNTEVSPCSKSITCFANNTWMRAPARVPVLCIANEPRTTMPSLGDPALPHLLQYHREHIG